MLNSVITCELSLACTYTNRHTIIAFYKYWFFILTCHEYLISNWYSNQIGTMIRKLSGIWPMDKLNLINYYYLDLWLVTKQHFDFSSLNSFFLLKASPKLTIWIQLLSWFQLNPLLVSNNLVHQKPNIPKNQVLILW